MPFDDKELFEFGPFRLDAAERQLFRGQELVPLTAKAFDVLLLLVRNAERTVTKEEFMATVWGGTVVEEANLTDNISTLRQALGDDAREPRFIKTLPKRGYRFVAPLTRPVPASATTATTPVPGRGAAGNGGSRGRRHAASLFLAAVALVSVAGIVRWQKTSPASPIRSIAVFPFDPLGDDASDTNLGVSLADSLITHLTSIDELVVRPASAVLGYANGKQTPLAAAREQNVDAFVEGRVRKRGTRIRVTVQLVSVREARTLWARTFDEDAANLFAVEDRIAEEVARQLAVRFEGTGPRHTPGAEAYELYGAGRYLWTRRTPDALEQSVDAFRRAIAVDPQFALAHAGLADAWSAIGLWNFRAPGEVFPEARRAALQALSLDPGLAEARTSLAYVKFRHDWDVAGAEDELRRALDSRPNSAAAHAVYGELLTVTARFDEADQHLRRARELDPRSSYAAFLIATRHYFMRDFAQAAKEVESLLARDPDFFIGREFAWAVYREAGDERRSLQMRWDTLRPQGVSQDAIDALQNVHRTSGIAAYRRAENDFLESQAKTQYVPPVFLAMNHAQNGDASAALPWLEKAYAERSGWLLELRVDPVWDPIRNDARFEALARKVIGP